MHVLMLCALEVWALPGAGGAPSLARTLQAYVDRGHHVTFIGANVGANAYLPDGNLRRVKHIPQPFPGIRFDMVNVPSLQRLPLPLPHFLKTVDQKLRFALLYTRMAATHAAGVLEGEAVDVLYGYEVHGALAAERLRDRWHGPTVARFQGTVLYPTLGDRIARLRKYEEVIAVRSLADLYIMTDDGTRGDEVLSTLNPHSEGRVRFWRNGLAMDRLRPATSAERLAQRRALGVAEEAFVLITASRLVAWKRVDRAIDALAQVRRALPNVFLLIVGDGHERVALEERARDRDVADAVRFVGAVPQEDVAGLMHAADVFLAVADLSNVGNPLLEAMACGLAIVAVDAGNTRDLVHDGETGRLVATGEPSAIARVVQELGADADTRSRIAAGARRYAQERFWTWDERMDAEVAEVERLVEESRAAPASRNIHG